MEEPEHVLTSHDIVHELRIDDISFMSVLDDISKIAREMGSKKYMVTKSQLLARKRSNSTGGIVQMDDHDNNNDHDDYHTSKKARIEGVDGDNNTTFKSNEENDQSNDLPSNGKPNYMAESKFMEWKDKMIQSILPDLHVTSTTNHEESSASNSLTKYEFNEMKKHANEVLQRYKNSNV